MGLLSYNPETGVFRWKISKSGVKSSRVSGCFDKDGYLRIGVNGAVYKAHRLAWLYVYGRFPMGQIDHVNGKRDDNRIDNLRECSAHQNGQNKIRIKRGASGFRGVYKSGNKWEARISAQSRIVYLGLFATREEAFAARLEAEKHHQPFRARF